MRIALFLLFFLILPSCHFTNAERESPWIDSWASSHLSTQVTKFKTEVQPTSPAQFSNQTVRLIIWNQLAGDTVRVKFSNVFGQGPLHIGAAHIAVVDKTFPSPNGAIIPSSDRTLNFAGKTSVILNPGEEIWSDEVSLSVAALENLAISLYLPDQFTPVQFHPTALKTSFVFSLSGDHTSDILPDAQATKTSMLFFASDLQIKPVKAIQHKARAARVLVALGDSITDGAVSDLDTNSNWPSSLAKRLAKQSRSAPIAVINMGIGSNRFCASDGAGPSGLHRLSKDVLSRQHLSWVILLEGINDISYEHISATELIECYRNAITQIHARGVKVYQSPLLPIKNSVKDTPENEATRLAVNDWIRRTTSAQGGPDAVIDFESAVWDPNDHAQILKDFTTDHVHPNSAGYQKMAEAIDLNLFLIN